MISAPTSNASHREKLRSQILVRRRAVGYLGLVGIAILLSTSGCGESAGNKLGISGKVTFKGQPLASGTIEFSAEDNSAMSGAVITNGEYSIAAVQGLPPGNYLVRLHAADEKAAASSEAPGPESLQPAAKELIPDDFNVATKLKYEVRSGQKNEYNIDIP